MATTKSVPKSNQVAQANLEQNKTLLVLSALTHALNHRIRSPLSVISNELIFLKEKLGEDEVKRPLRHLQEIIEVLNDISNLGPTSASAQPITLSIFSRDCLSIRSIPKGMEKISLLLDPALSKAACAYLQRLFQKLEIDMRSEFLSAQGSVNLCFSALPPLPQILRESKTSICHSLGELFNLQLALDYLEPPLIDSLFWAQGCTIRATLQEGLLIEVTLPYADSKNPTG